MRLSCGAFLLAAFLGAALAPAARAQCPMCKDALTGGGSEEALSAASSGGPAAGNPGLARGFFWSVLFMLAMPFTLAGIIVRQAMKPSRPAGAPGAADGPPAT